MKIVLKCVQRYGRMQSLPLLPSLLSLQILKYDMRAMPVKCKQPANFARSSSVPHENPEKYDLPTPLGGKLLAIRLIKLRPWIEATARRAFQRNI